MSHDTPVRLTDFEAAASARLPADVRDFVAGGSGDELTVALNRAFLDRTLLVPRMLTGVADPDLGTRLLNTAAAMPVSVAPMAYQRLVHPAGEPALACAAEAAGIPYTVSMMSSTPVEEIAKSGAALWFQLYWLPDRDRLLRLVRRAERSGVRALMVTVDVPIAGRRPRDIRNEFTLPPGITAVHLDDDASAGTRHPGESAMAVHTNSVFDPTASWADLAWLRARTELPLVVKGILDVREAVRAVETGVDGIVVSNHGGRQLDGVPPSVAVLPEIVGAVGGQCEILLDSGIRSAQDVLRALALGASGVLLGRPLLWGLALDGADGAGRVLSLLRTELTETFVLTGCADVASAHGLETRVIS
jgi:4-hydroxymandelate oxidase